MSFDDLEARLDGMMDDVFAKPDERAGLELLDRQLRSGEISRAEALRRLDRLQHGSSVRPLQFTPEQIQDEFEKLAGVIKEGEDRASRQARNQFYIGLTALPVAVVLAAASLFLGWHDDEGATMVAALVAACLAAVATHSFVVLRVHQQAGLAAERLAEKRLGVIFLRLATAREDPAERERLLQAGTSMFLGHHAPATLPLEAGDFSIKQSG